jgi:sulfide:quinone oxidoreductase
MTHKKIISSKKPLKIAIVGGGLAGTTMAYRLSRAITYPQITLFEPLESSAWYQSGLGMFAMGLYCQKDIEYKREDFLPQSIKWVQSRIISIDTTNNKLIDSNNEIYSYDYLIIATGLMLNYSHIQGLTSNITTMQMLETKDKWMDTNSIGSLCYYHGAKETDEQVNTIIQKATETKDKITILFTQPTIMSKSLGASKSLLLMIIDKLQQKGLQHKAKFILCSGDGLLSSSSKYDKLYKQQLISKGVIIKKLTLTKVDIDNNIAIFDDMSSIEYDFLHITPPMSVDEIFNQSNLCNKYGFIDVEKTTLQHKKHQNIFAIGDAAGIDAIKSGASIVPQVKIVVDTIRAIDEGKKIVATYDGFGCDSVFDVSNQKVLLEAYDYNKQPFAFIRFLKPLKFHKIYWYIHTKILKLYVMYGVMRGWA